MARQVEITHTYHITIPADEQGAIRELSRVAVRIMENHLSEINGLLDLHSDWKLLPRYDPYPREMTVEEAEARFFHDEPALHPWDQGLRIFPREHPLFDAETQALRQQGLISEEEEGETKAIESGESGD